MGLVIAEARIEVDGRTYPGDFSVHTDQLEVTSLGSVPDPSWEFVDKAGHYHSWSAPTGTKGHTLPTLRERLVWVEFIDPENHEETGYHQSHWHCQICDEEVIPGRKSETGPRYIPGRQSWEVTFRAPDLMPRELMSVKVISAAKVYFGVAAIVDYRFPEFHLVGTGELGSRKLTV